MSDSHEQRPSTTQVAWGLIACGVLARWLPHPPNVTPLAALALFGGAALSKRWAIVFPLVVVAMSDAVLGFHDTIAFTWAGFALTGLLGLWVRRDPRPGRIAAGALAGSGLFFLITNVGVWLLGDGGTMYPHTLDGLWSCFVAALPFFRNSLMGDVVYTAAIFSLYRGFTRLMLTPEAARAR